MAWLISLGVREDGGGRKLGEGVPAAEAAAALEGIRGGRRRWVSDTGTVGHGWKKAWVVVLGARAKRRRLHRKGEMLLLPPFLLKVLVSTCLTLHLGAAWRLMVEVTGVLRVHYVVCAFYPRRF